MEPEEEQYPIESEEQDADRDDNWKSKEDHELGAEPFEDVKSDNEDALYEPDIGGR